MWDMLTGEHFWNCLTITNHSQLIQKKGSGRTQLARFFLVNQFSVQIYTTRDDEKTIISLSKRQCMVCWLICCLCSYGAAIYTKLQCPFEVVSDRKKPNYLQVSFWCLRSMVTFWYEKGLYLIQPSPLFTVGELEKHQRTSMLKKTFRKRLVMLLAHQALTLKVPIRKVPPTAV
jgi:hypothetical protein